MYHQDAASLLPVTTPELRSCGMIATQTTVLLRGAILVAAMAVLTVLLAGALG